METTPSPEEQEVSPGTADYEALMVEKFEDSQKTDQLPAGEDAPKVERPAWLPEKFASPEDLAKAYQELETKQSHPVPEDGDNEGDKARDLVDSAGLSFDGFATEFAETGELSDKSYEALAAKGITRDIVDQFIEGQAAQAQLFRSEVLGDLSDEDFDSMTSWAAEGGLSTAEVAAFNSQVEKDAATAKLAISGLKARYDIANGVEPSLLKGDAATTGDVFRSSAELTAAMRDPRYKVDPAYRADVQAKLGRSSIL